MAVSSSNLTTVTLRENTSGDISLNKRTLRWT